MQSKRDQNFVTTKTAVLNTNGLTVTRLKANPLTHVLKTNNGTTGTDLGPTYALRDENNIPTLLAVSSSDGRTPVALYADLNGALLINSS